ncbi:MAG: ATP:cob(I)alamin adenosyltransferase [Candidatus Levybacteria bacterium RBG_16_35_11]|nr:MAG: ATP:cob(I)alamin adenosyltransferase [Candidatus Levybacteria bacterium RBG_16_35_11]
MSIYTRAGDKGKTILKDGKKVSKSHIRLEAYGTVDELNSSLGISIANLKDNSLKKELLKIQNDLFEVGGQLASTKKNKKLDLFLEKRVRDFENLIDKWTKKLPKLTHFILPGGEKGSFLHLSRTICRRAERRVVSLSKKETVDNNVIVYLNRLSDLLFTMARFANKIDKEKEIVWKIG